MSVWLAESVLTLMHAEARRIYPLETGGVLIGWRSGVDRVIVDMRGPGLSALHGQTRFFPDHSWQLSEIRKLFASSNGDLDYLGDWHTHPDGVAMMSEQDESTLQRISRRVASPLMAILAGGAMEWNMGCWFGHRGKGYMRRPFNIADQTVRTFNPPAGWNLRAGRQD